MTFHAGVHTFTVDAIVFCLILCHAEKKYACFMLMLVKSNVNVTVENRVILGRLVSIHLNICKRGLVHGNRGKLAEISKSEVHILTMSQPALFLCSLFNSSGLRLSQAIFPMRTVVVGRIYLQFYRFPAGLSKPSCTYSTYFLTWITLSDSQQGLYG